MHETARGRKAGRGAGGKKSTRKLKRCMRSLALTRTSVPTRSPPIEVVVAENGRRGRNGMGKNRYFEDHVAPSPDMDVPPAMLAADGIRGRRTRGGTPSTILSTSLPQRACHSRSRNAQQPPTAERMGHRRQESTAGRTKRPRQPPRWRELRAERQLWLHFRRSAYSGAGQDVKD